MRSFWAIFAGVLFVMIVTTLVDTLLHLVHVYPPMNQPIDDKLAVLATSYRFVISVAGAWITARLAPSRPMWHALILGAIGTVLGTAGVVATWNLALGPRWYAILLAALAIPQCWLGGWLYARNARNTTAGVA